MIRRAEVKVVAVASVALLLAGCTSSPTVLPDVVVEHAGTSPLDENEWVVAVRATQLAQILAWNSGDYTTEQLRVSTSPAAIERYYASYAASARNGASPEVFVGPLIWAPISVSDFGDTAQLVVCVATQDRRIDEEHPPTVYGLDTGIVETWTYERLASGAIERTDGHESLDQCSAEMAEVLTFDPAPTLPEKINEGDIRAPADSD